MIIIYSVLEQQQYCAGHISWWRQGLFMAIYVLYCCVQLICSAQYQEYQDLNVNGLKCRYQQCTIIICQHSKCSCDRPLSQFLPVRLFSSSMRSQGIFPIEKKYFVFDIIDSNDSYTTTYISYQQIVIDVHYYYLAGNQQEAMQVDDNITAKYF